jgi:hypothetical protein
VAVHSLGKGEVEGSIPSISTKNLDQLAEFGLAAAVLKTEGYSDVVCEFESHLIRQFIGLRHMAHEAGKGSSPRPYSVSQQQFANNWDAIFGKKSNEGTVDDKTVEQTQKTVDTDDGNS